MQLKAWIIGLLGGQVPVQPEPITGKNDHYPYSEAWDVFISQALDGGEVVALDGCEALVGGHKVWIANYPFAFGKPRNGIEVLPSLATRKRLHAACVVSMIAQVPKREA